MQAELDNAAGEIFRFRELLKDIVMAAMNTPDETLDKVFNVYQEFVEMVESLQPFTSSEVQTFLDKTLVRYAQKPFFPILAGLFVNALLNKLFQTQNQLEINIERLCYGIVDDAAQGASSDEENENEMDVNFSLDFLGYLMPENKKLTIQGPVGDFAGALMGKHSSLIVNGMHGKQFGYEKDPTARAVQHK
jgi:hypothetical protein